MGTYIFKMPDLGEGTVSAEILQWNVKAGDVVQEDQIVAEVMTEKAAIEIPAPVSGRVVRRQGERGDVIAVGSELIAFETDAAVIAAPADAAPAPQVQSAAPAGRVMASPATRRRAKEAGIDLQKVAGSGPGGRVTRADFEAAASGHGPVAGTAQGTALPAAARVRREGTTEVKIIGLRRVIAQRMSEAKRNIPHFAFVEEVDVTELEALRVHLNATAPGDAPSLTLLPFLGLALARVLPAFPQCNALHDAERNIIVQHAALHLGIATQTPDGLKVPVVRHAEALSLRGLSSAIREVSDRARRNKSPREELAGSTITVTSLGKLGGIASTPVINAPEVAIIGVNKAVERPVVYGGAITIRRMMNLSSSFDHRFVDGFDAASMIQALKALLEHPATIFMADEDIAR